jgi:hypothetical protein
MLVKDQNPGAKNEDEIGSLSAEKKVNYLNGKFSIVLDGRIINYLHINENDDLWVRQTPSDDGIFMKLL